MEVLYKRKKMNYLSLIVYLLQENFMKKILFNQELQDFVALEFNMILMKLIFVEMNWKF